MNTLKIFAILVLLLIVGVIATPFIYGIIVKNKYYEVVSIIKKDYDVDIKVINYKKGWFNSEATLEISDANRSNKPVLLQQTLDHGPIVYDDNTNSYKLAAAAIVSKNPSFPGIKIKYPDGF